MTENLGELKAETLNETPADVKAKVLVHAKADTLEEV